MNSEQSPGPKKKNKKVIAIVIVSVVLITCFLCNTPPDSFTLR